MADPNPQTFRLAIGQSKVLRVTLLTPESVAGWSMRFRLKKAGITPIVEKTLAGGGVTIVNAVTGVWDITIVAGDCGGWTPGEATWSFWDVAVGEESPTAYGTADIYRAGP